MYLLLTALVSQHRFSLVLTPWLDHRGLDAINEWPALRPLCQCFIQTITIATPSYKSFRYYPGFQYMQISFYQSSTLTKNLRNYMNESIHCNDFLGISIIGFQISVSYGSCQNMTPQAPIKYLFIYYFINGLSFSISWFTASTVSGFMFIVGRNLKSKSIYFYSKPTWKHLVIFIKSPGNIKVGEYKSRGL